MTTGQFIDGSYTNSYGSRDYKLYVPSKYIGQPVPLLVMLHGCTQSPDDLATGTRMNSFAEENTFLVAYPSQASSANSARCWNWWRPTDQRRGQGEPSIIAGITQQIKSAYSVDPNRVYVAGISAGAAMAVILAVTYPDIYAAIGVHSGVAYGAAHSVFSGFRTMRQGRPDHKRQAIHRQMPTATAPFMTMRFVPLILFHGDADRAVNEINAEQVISQWISAYTAALGNRASRLQTKYVQVQVPNGRAYTRTIYYGFHEQEIMEKWITHGAGHAWAGGDSRVAYMDPLGPDASAEMIRFFLEHPRQETSDQ